jgi:hypothetical protein
LSIPTGYSTYHFHSLAKFVLDLFLEFFWSIYASQCKHPKAEEAFKLIAEAFEILSDEKKRKEYDNGSPPNFTV